MALQEAQARREARRSLIGFTEYTFPNYTAAPLHHRIAEQLERVERGEIDRLMLHVPPRFGKALEERTPIPTPSGWTCIGDLKPGDVVFDDKGEQCRVTGVSEVWRNRPIYRVLTDDGDEILADGEHEWLVRLCRKYPVQKLKTTQWLANRSSNRAPMITAQGALNLPDVSLPIDPYVLGVWLGDGRTLYSTMCSADDEIVAEVSRLEGGHNNYATIGKTQHFRIGPHFRHEGVTQAQTLQGRLRTLGLLGNKRIPTLYARAGTQQRWALLQGLVDTDGYVGPKGQIEFCSILEGLARDVRELVCSLGHKASLIIDRARINGRDCGPRYRVMFYAKGAARLTRKASKTRDGIRTYRRYIAVEPAGIGDTVCIEVDSPSHMFLCGKSMLPTHNSELASRRFPAYYLGRHPNRQFISASGTVDLASDFGRDVRNIMLSEEYRNVFETRLSPDNTAKGRWSTPQGGKYYAVGVGSAIMGRGAHVMLIDDPFATMADAQSPTERKAVWAWYTGSVYNRLEKNGAIVIINHRMHEDDLSGMLLAEQAAGGDRWDVVELKALNEDDESLWPEKFSTEALHRIRRNTYPPSNWSALYQQNPTPDEGTYFLADWLKPYVEVPDRRTLQVYGASDYAVTDDGGDYTVHGVVGIDPEDRIYLLDLWRGRTTPDVWVETWCDLVEKWKPLGWAEETGQITKSVGPWRNKRALERRAFVACATFPTSGGDKSVRAQSIRGRMGTAGRGIYVPVHAPWYADFRSEILAFPAGRHDDIVDMLGLVGMILDRMVKGRPVPKDAEPKILSTDPSQCSVTLNDVWDSQPKRRAVGRIR